MLLYVLLYFSLFGGLASAIQALICFLRRDTYLSKINFKYTLIFLPLFILLSLISLFFSDIQQKESDILFGVVLYLIFFILLRKLRIDPFNNRHWRFILNEIKGGKDKYMYRKDWAHAAKTALFYIVLLFIVSSLEITHKGMILTSILTIGFFHTMLFGKFQGLCPFCGYKVFHIKRTTTSIRCGSCKQIIVVHGNELTRPKGYRT